MKLTVKIEGLDDLTGAFQRIKGACDTVLEPAARAGAEVIRNEAIKKAPGPHIELNVKRVTQKKAEVVIGPDKEHWYYQFAEYGTSAHTVKPSKKKALSWPGGPVVKKVMHPGRSRDPFLQPAIENNQSSILSAISEALRKAIR